MKISHQVLLLGAAKAVAPHRQRHPRGTGWDWLGSDDSDWSDSSNTEEASESTQTGIEERVLWLDGNIPYCVNGAYDDEIGKCVCYPGFKLSSTGNDAICQREGANVINDDEGDCNGVWCDPDHGYCGSDNKCVCDEGFTGAACDIVVQNRCDEWDGCFNGVCHDDGSEATCTCSHGWYGDACNYSHCSGHGRAALQLGGYRCECYDGFHGEFCQDQSPHTHSPTTTSSTTTISTKRSTTTWTSTSTTSQVECRMPCENGGSCVIVGNSNRCSCLPGFEGTYCHKRVNPCGLNCHNGVCLIEHGDEFCECSNGWGGRLCDKRKYDTTCSKNCGNGACVGTDQDGTARCQCFQEKNWEGENCLQQKCDMNCNNGRCMIEIDQVMCICDNGWTGLNCDEVINDNDACSPSPCLNGCSCSTDAEGGFVCTNQEGRYFLGNKCQFGEPTLACNRDHIALTTGSDILDDWKFANGLGGAVLYNNEFNNEMCRFGHQIRPQLTIPSDEWNQCGNRMEVRDGKLVISNKVWRDVNHDTMSFATPMFQWECHYAVVVDEYHLSQFTHVSDNMVAIVEQNNFNIRMRFFYESRDVANRKQLTAKDNQVFVNQGVYFNIDLAADLGLRTIYPNLRLRLEHCTVTSYDRNGGEPESFAIIEDQCPTPYGLADIVYNDANEVEVLFHNYRDRRNPQSAIGIQCSVSMCTGCMPRKCERRKRRHADSIQMTLESLLFVDEDNKFIPQDVEEFKILDTVSIENGPLFPINESNILELDHSLVTDDL